MDNAVVVNMVTTLAQLQEVFVSVLDGMAMAQLPLEVVELEKLKRKEYLTEAEVEKLFGLKKATLRKRRFNGEGPAYSKDGERVLYARRLVEQYLESRRQKTHDQP